jgi:N-acetylneuraminic acid mutarotase
MLVWGGNGSALYGDGALYNPVTDSWRPISSTGAPSARDGMTALWTGTEMVIWGGHDNVNLLNTGALYNPTTDTWRPMATANAPTARTWTYFPVWTGTELIVWGGANLNLSTTFNTGARYNPTTDTWTPMSTTGAPSGRNRASMIWTGKEMVMFGGATGAGSGTYVNTGARYNPDNDTWTTMTITGAPSARVHHSVIWTGASMLIYGGYTGSGYPTDLTSYSPAFDYQTITASWLEAYFGSSYRHDPIAIEHADADGDGYDNVAEFSGGSDPKDGSSIPGEWLERATSEGISGRSIYASAWTGKELLIWGGEGFGVSFGTGGRYSPRTDSWTEMSTEDAPVNRSQLASVWTGTEFIVWGGYNGTQVNSGGRYNPVSDSWVAMSTAGAPSPRSYPAIAWTGTEVIIWGGVSNGTYLNDGAIYNPDTDSWRPLASTGAPLARCLPAHVWTGTELVVWGGSGTAGPLGDGAAFNPSTDNWRPISSVNAPVARTWMFQTAWTGTEMIVWGGANQELTDSYNTGARYNPTTDSWTVMSTQNAPSPRNRLAMTWTGDALFVFGGADDNVAFLNDGGFYNPILDRWSPLITEGAPSARVHHHAVWTGISVLVYGGYTGSEHSDELYSFSNARVEGLPEEWLAEFFGAHYRHDPSALATADPDNDGNTNLREYQLETNPLDPFSGFAVALRMSPTISWGSVPDVSYRVMRKNSLEDASWVTISTVRAVDAMTTFVDLTSTSSTGFYKVEPLEK